MKLNSKRAFDVCVVGSGPGGGIATSALAQAGLKASSFYENLPPAEAFELAQRFEMHYTPKKGSWLNMAELALSRICLSRRIKAIEELDREIQSLVKERNKLQVKVEWQFSISQAREKLSRHYDKVKSKN